MKLEINNLGPIKNAKIDLSKKLTVFCGPNNSGKTYLSFLVYAFAKSGLKYFRDDSDKEFITELFEKGFTKYEININSLF
ncbi:AAA family ATPase [Flavicella sediminum]|uniref:AAA family ATPase n=1 Tax=Flavicella sediminum TaxID=2585141 RepID=UPI001122E9C6|nr:AAA family ATPase [Flavicella sediminum]